MIKEKMRLSGDRLISVIVDISKNGPTEVAKKYATSINALRKMIETQFSRICEDNADGCPNANKARGIMFKWEDFGAIDPKYTPPQYLMNELNALLSTFVVGMGVISRVSEDYDIYTFVADIIERADELCRKELAVADSVHRMCHLHALNNSFNLSVITVLNKLLGNIPNSSAPITICASEKLCGLINVDIPGAKKIRRAAFPNVKRHGQFLSQSELADMLHVSVSSIAASLRNIADLVDKCKVASAIDAAEDAGVDVSQYKTPNPPDKKHSWYSEDEACKFLEIGYMSDLNENLLPPHVAFNGVNWYIESDIVAVYEFMEENPNKVPEKPLFAKKSRSTNIVLPQPPDKNSSWLTEIDACKAMGIFNIVQLPVDLRPTPCVSQGMNWYRAEDCELICNKLAAV